MEILTAYVRQHAPWPPEEAQQVEVADIRAIITVIGRRKRAFEQGEPGRLDLRKTNLLEADLGRANLGGANLYKANLYGADLHGANLSAANLSGADLSGAHLERANLWEADLYQRFAVTLNHAAW